MFFEVISSLAQVFFHIYTCGCNFIFSHTVFVFQKEKKKKRQETKESSEEIEGGKSKKKTQTKIKRIQRKHGGL